MNYMRRFPYNNTRCVYNKIRLKHHTIDKVENCIRCYPTSCNMFSKTPTKEINGSKPFEEWIKQRVDANFGEIVHNVRMPQLLSVSNYLIGRLRYGNGDISSNVA